eukprot:6293552-Prorocentrum_lima.AAC.1
MSNHEACSLPAASAAAAEPVTRPPAAAKPRPPILQSPPSLPRPPPGKTPADQEEVYVRLGN